MNNMEGNKEIIKKIAEGEVPFQDIIKKMELFLDMKDAIEELKEVKELSEDEGTFKEAEQQISLAEEDLACLNKEIAKFFQEDRKELYSFDEIGIKLKELYKKQYEIKKQIDSN
ncbi:MAG TPA: hypothetical protein PLO44_02035 [Candidatus Paceibacterota bacterium]|nr:hypothetical protein [Candidatus Paceibacterota bacterium]